MCCFFLDACQDDNSNAQLEQMDAATLAGTLVKVSRIASTRSMGSDAQAAVNGGNTYNAQTTYNTVSSYASQDEQDEVDMLFSKMSPVRVQPLLCLHLCAAEHTVGFVACDLSHVILFHFASCSSEIRTLNCAITCSGNLLLFLFTLQVLNGLSSAHPKWNKHVSVVTRFVCIVSSIHVDKPQPRRSQQGTCQCGCKQVT